MNILNFTISITWYILLSFFLISTDLYWKISHILILQNYEFDSKYFLLLSQPDHITVAPLHHFFFIIFFSLSNLTFLWPDLVFFISFEFIFLISCFDYLHLIATYFLNHSFSYPFQYSHKKQKDSLKTPAVLLTFSLELEISWVIHKRRIHQNSEKWWLFWGIA